MLKKLKFAQSLQSSIGNLLSRLPISATQITALAFLFALAGFFLSAARLPFHSLAFFVLAGVADALDGAVARAKKQVSARGAYIDGITDRLVEFLFILSFFFYLLPPFIMPAYLSLICILFFGSCMSTFATAYADHRKVATKQKLASEPGILPRPERLILLYIAFLLIPFAPFYTAALAFAGAVLAFITFAQRFWHFAK